MVKSKHGRATSATTRGNRAFKCNRAQTCRLFVFGEAGPRRGSRGAGPGAADRSAPPVQNARLRCYHVDSRARRARRRYRALRRLSKPRLASNEVTPDKPAVHQCIGHELHRLDTQPVVPTEPLARKALQSDERLARVATSTRPIQLGARELEGRRGVAARFQLPLFVRPSAIVVMAPTRADSSRERAGTPKMKRAARKRPFSTTRR